MKDNPLDDSDNYHDAHLYKYRPVTASTTDRFGQNTTFYGPEVALPTEIQGVNFWYHMTHFCGNEQGTDLPKSEITAKGVRFGYDAVRYSDL